MDVGSHASPEGRQDAVAQTFTFTLYFKPVNLGDRVRDGRSHRRRVVDGVSG